jgi:hypothetical protein
MRSRTLALILLGALSLAPAPAQPVAFETPFWPGRSARQDPRFLRIEPHPCGEVAIARTTTVPGTRATDPLIAETVREIGSAGQTLRRWRVPVDSYPIAIPAPRPLPRRRATLAAPLRQANPRSAKP